jgi:threonine synthase
MSVTPTPPIASRLVCGDCAKTYAVTEPRIACNCGGLLTVEHEITPTHGARLLQTFAERWACRSGSDGSGVWRYRELLGDFAQPVTRLEGNTNLYANASLRCWTGSSALLLKHEGENPTGSFKDRGMTVGVSQAERIGAKAVVCASTGNTSSSLASYAAFAGLPCIVFVPLGKITAGKLAQSIAYGARVIQIEGDFDAALTIARAVCQDMGLYLLNSVNPWRLEGQKSIIFEMLQQLDWQIPDWIAVPGGNLGNTSAFGKALRELAALGIVSRLPRLAVIQAQGANPFYQAFRGDFRSFAPVTAHTVATAINIGNPANYQRARRAIIETNGVVEEVSDDEILAAKAAVDVSGIGCEPASAATVAGVRKLVRAGVIKPDDSVVGVLTGHILKDPDAVVAYHTQQGWKAEIVAAEASAVRSVLEKVRR